MAKKSHADIMEKLSALKPSEPTKTRGKAARKPAVKKPAAKKAAAAKRPAAAPPPEYKAPPIPKIGVAVYSGYGPFGGAAKMYLDVYENWYRLVSDANRTIADFNSLFVNNLTYLVNPGRWWRF
jgi:hypothetical protein